MQGNGSRFGEVLAVKLSFVKSIAVSSVHWKRKHWKALEGISVIIFYHAAHFHCTCHCDNRAICTPTIGITIFSAIGSRCIAVHLIWRGGRQSHRWPPAWAQRTAAQIKNCTQGYLISVVLNFFDKPLLSTEREAEGLVLAGGPSKVLNSASFPHTWCLSWPMQRISTINTDP